MRSVLTRTLPSVWTTVSRQPRRLRGGDRHCPDGTPSHARHVPSGSGNGGARRAARPVTRTMTPAYGPGCRHLHRPDVLTGSSQRSARSTACRPRPPTWSDARRRTAAPAAGPAGVSSRPVHPAGRTATASLRRPLPPQHRSWPSSCSGCSGSSAGAQPRGCRSRHRYERTPAAPDRGQRRRRGCQATPPGRPLRGQRAADTVQVPARLDLPLVAKTAVAQRRTATRMHVEPS